MPSTGSASAVSTISGALSEPTADDLTALLRSANLLTTTLTAAQSETDFEQAIAAAILAWERATGYTPFIAEQATRDYDPPKRCRLPLATGLLSVTAVRTNVSLTNPTGTLLVENQDFRLEPRIAPHNGQPYTYIDFRYGPYSGYPFTWITVTGLFGCVLSWPADAFQAVLRLAAAILLPEFQLQVSKGAIRIKQDDVEIQYASNSILTAVSAWQSVVNGALATYTRRTIY